ncbi:MAG: DUF4249 family protein [Saprospiraceae bacterium]|nr:DUF4249 family protein [Saprospiraceae bacterium]
MNFRNLFLLVLILAAGLSSCENEFDLVAPGAEPIPVVYGLIDRNDTAHYIRVEKAFVDQTTDPLQLAQDPTNLYYDDLSVQIQRTGSQTATYTLDRVDGNLEGYVREEGIFSNTPNYLYKLKLPSSQKFQSGDELTLVLSTGELDEDVTATAKVLGDFTITAPSQNFNYGWAPESTYTLRWNDPADLSYAFDINLTIHYEEKVGSEPFVDRSFIWQVAKGYTPDLSSSTRKYEGDGLAFYQALVDNISESTNEIRRFKNFDVEIKGVGEALFDYITIGQVNTGITSAQIIPTYSNLSLGRGIFSSKVETVQKSYTISSNTREFLEEYPLVVPLNFQ